MIIFGFQKNHSGLRLENGWEKSRLKTGRPVRSLLKLGWLQLGQQHREWRDIDRYLAGKIHMTSMFDSRGKRKREESELTSQFMVCTKGYY